MVKDNIIKMGIATMFAFASLLSIFAFSTQTGALDIAEVPVPIDYCDSSNRPAGMSVAEWLNKKEVDGSDCFELEAVQVCGSLNVVLANDTDLAYEVRYVEGTEVPASWEGDGVLPVNFDEDYNGGSVEVTYYIVGAEKDYLVGSELPNFWDGNGVTVTVDTNCEEKVAEEEEDDGQVLAAATQVKTTPKGSADAGGSGQIALFGLVASIAIASIGVTTRKFSRS